MYSEEKNIKKSWYSFYFRSDPYKNETDPQQQQQQFSQQHRVIFVLTNIGITNYNTTSTVS